MDFGLSRNAAVALVAIPFVRAALLNKVAKHRGLTVILQLAGQKDCCPSNWPANGRQYSATAQGLIPQ